jgi:hypothetical protein
MIEIDDQKELKQHEYRVCRHLGHMMKFDEQINGLFGIRGIVGFAFISPEYWWPIDKLDQAKRVFNEYTKSCIGIELFPYQQKLLLDSQSAREISYYIFNKTYLKECRFYKKYKGLKRPKCNKGFGCESCWDKYVETQTTRRLK